MCLPVYDTESHSLYFASDDTSIRSFDLTKINVFLCGSLQHPDKFFSFTGTRPLFAPAVAVGYARGWEEIGSESIMFMKPSDEPSRILTGTVYLGLSDDEVARIESFELKGDLRERVRIDVHVGDRLVDAITYLKKTKNI